MSRRAEKFFDERSDQSEVKARIVERYFYTWAQVVLPSARQRGESIAYIDLYAGPGRYRDGSASTPLMVLQRAIDDSKLAASLVALFNDRDKNHTAALQAEIDRLPGIEKLAHKPVVRCGAVDEDAEAYFNRTRMVPSFTFIDPFGYVGLSLRIIRGVIKDWGCDCVFFFNYGRINAGISNPAVAPRMDALFGSERADDLRSALSGRSADEREALILEALAAAIKEMGGTFVLPFTFRSTSGERTTHSLVFVSKHPKGYEIMKKIMAKESSVADEGVPSFAYSPADASMPLLFSLNRPAQGLEASILERFAGQRISMRNLFLQHNVDTPFISRNYKDALLRLEAAGRIQADPPATKRRRHTFADGVMITFPPAGKG